MESFNNNLESFIKARHDVPQSKASPQQQIDELITILGQSNKPGEIISLIQFNPDDQDALLIKLMETSNNQHLSIIIKCLFSMTQQFNKIPMSLKLIIILQSLSGSVEQAHELLLVSLSYNDACEVFGLINQTDVDSKIFDLFLKITIAEETKVLKLFGNTEFKKRLIADLDIKNKLAQEFLIQSLNLQLPQADISEIAVHIITNISKGPCDFNLQMAATLSGLYPLAIGYLIDRTHSFSILCETAQNKENVSSASQLSAIITIKNYLRSKKNASHISQTDLNQVLLNLNKSGSSSLLTLGSHLIAEYKRLFKNYQVIRDSIIANIHNQNPQALKIMFSSLRSLLKVVDKDDVRAQFDKIIQAVTELMQDLIDSEEPSEIQQLVICINFLGFMFKYYGSLFTKMDLNILLESIQKLEFIEKLQEHKSNSVSNAAIRIISSYIELQE